MEVFSKDRMGSVHMQCSYCVRFEYICFSILCVSSSFGNSCSHGGRKSITEQPGCWTSCSAVGGVGFGYQHIACFQVSGNCQCRSVSCGTSSVWIDTRTGLSPG